MKPIFQRPLEDILNGIGNRSLAFRPLPEEPAGTFNLKAMLERLMGDQDLAGSVIDGFLEDVPGQVLNLLRMLEAGDARGAERQAHSIRGASGVLSAERLSDTAQQIEIRARAGNIAEAAAFTSELEERLKELTSVLERSGLGSAGRLQI
jgi:HPt (histidine-containing phosphotransfer) domain-containing protein